MSNVEIFMDESGDLGFDFTKAKTSSHFVVTFLFTREPKRIEKIVSKVFRSFSKIEIKNHHGTLHAYKEKPLTRIRLLRYLAVQDIQILTIRLNKENVYTKLKDEKHVLYNYVVNILLDRMMRKKMVLRNESIRFVAAKRETNKFLNDNFKAYIQQKTKDNHKLEITVILRQLIQKKAFRPSTV